ncbi:MAG: Cof-type HAD-IIB family hydrolase [Lachnospiraceae bacterium]|nr:Cof-type HAD-IIB family hydrolase [Lachnospiraceae bacterium]
MRTKVLFADLDGTLLDDEKNVSGEDLATINEMIEKGHRFVIATGRPVYSAKVVAHDLSLYREGIYLAASNGGVIYDCGKEEVISAATLDTDIVDVMFKEALGEGISIHTYTNDNVVSVKETEEIRVYTKAIKMPFKLLDKIPEDLPAPPPKFIVMSIKENSRQILADFEARHAELVKGKAQSVFSNNYLLEYLPLGVSKGNAIKTLCDLLHIPIEDSIAAGDEANDIPMIKAAGIGAVMKNGTDETKSYADYITKKTNNESGVSEIIRTFILNEQR